MKAASKDMREASSFFQAFDLTQENWGELKLSVNETPLEYGDDFVYFSIKATKPGQRAEVVYYQHPDSLTDQAKGKIIGIGKSKYINEFLKKGKQLGVGGYIIIFEQPAQYESIKVQSRRYVNNRLKLKTTESHEKEGELIFVLNPDLTKSLFGNPNPSHGDKGFIEFTAQKDHKVIQSENVLGFIPGAVYPDEYVIVTSHYDHIGIVDGQINNGADDDGSGTTALLSIARAFSIANSKGFKPKRSLVFMTVSGEEKGLLGSKYYTDMAPVFPLGQTIANLNIDMIGRVDDTHGENENYIYLIGSDKLSTQLHELSENVNRKSLKLELDYTYNAEDDPNRFYYRSDHYNFAKNNIPVIFYFNGTHADYHKPTDTIEKINFKVLKKRSRLIFLTAWEIANRDQKLKLD